MGFAHDSVAFNTTNAFAFKFNMKYNLTEWIKYSNESFNMAATDLLYSDDETALIVMGDCFSNVLMNSSIESPFDYPNNSNVFVIAYEIDGAVIRWSKILGDPVGNDTYVSSYYYSGEIYVLQNSYSGYYNTKGLLSRDARMTRIIVETGDISSRLWLGGDTNTTGYDVIVNHQGIFVLLSYFQGLFPSVNNNPDGWGVPNASNCVPLLMPFHCFAR